MTFKICYWDDDAKEQKERDMTPEEEAQRLADIAAAQAPVVPAKVTRRQALQALFLRSPSISASDIETAITANLTGAAQGLALIEWRESLEFERSRPLVNSLGPLLGLTSADIDNLFIQAATL